jgi:cell shape-determining protein MreC
MNMESLINQLTSNKILMIIIVLMLSLLIYSLIKRLVKIIIIVIIALALYLGYMNYTGEKLDGNLQNFLDRGSKDLEEMQKKKEKLYYFMDAANKITE